MMDQENGLPDGWVLATLGEVCSTIKGKKPKDTGEKSIERDTPYINIKTFETKNVEIYASSGNYPECKPNDILIVWDGARSGLIGRGVSGYIGSTLAKVFSKTLTDTYLFYFLIFQYSYINTNTKGVGIPHVDPTIFFNIEVPVPPLAEQHRIVAEIEKQFSRLDEAVAGLKRIQANLKRYRASVLKAAVEGKLTAEWRKQHPDTEPAEQLLQRILRERRAHWEKAELEKMLAAGKPPKDDQWKQKYTEPVKPDVSGLPALPALPEGWVWSWFGQCFYVKVGATPSRKEESYWNGNIAWVSSGEIQFCRIKQTKELITELGFQNSSTQINPIGSILIGMIGEGKTRGQAAILDISACNNQNCAAIWVSQTPVKSELIYYWLCFRYQITRRIGSGNNQPALNKTLVEKIEFPLPPIEEQTQIVSEVERRLSIADEVEQQISTNLKRAERLRQSILKKAFSGRLVPQDPNDEPAGVLLEKIKQAQRA